MGNNQTIPVKTRTEMLRQRYEHSWKTRNHGYEHRSAENYYDSLLSHGPVGAIDRIVRLARVKDLPLGPMFDQYCESWEKLTSKSGNRYKAYSLKRHLTPQGFHIRTGKSGKVYGQDTLIYLELVDLPWKTSVSEPFVDALLLAD